MKIENITNMYECPSNIKQLRTYIQIGSINGELGLSKNLKLSHLVISNSTSIL